MNKLQLDSQLPVATRAYWHEGSHCIDWDADPKRQLSIMILADGRVVWAIYLTGERLNGNSVDTPDFRNAIYRWSHPAPLNQTLATQPPPGEVVAWLTEVHWKGGEVERGLSLRDPALRKPRERNALDDMVESEAIRPLTYAATRDAGEDSARLDWLESNELALCSEREGFGDDEYGIWWRVVRVKAIKGDSISGHPLGSVRAAIDAAKAAQPGRGGEG